MMQPSTKQGQTLRNALRGTDPGRDWSAHIIAIEAAAREPHREALETALIALTDVGAGQSDAIAIRASDVARYLRRILRDKP